MVFKTRTWISGYLFFFHLTDLDREGDNIDLSQVFTDPRAGLVPSAPQRGGFFSRGSSVSVTTIRGADGVIIMSVLIII